MSKPIQIAATRTPGGQTAIADVRAAFREARPVVQLVFAMRFAVGGTLSLSSTTFSPLHAVAGQTSWLAAVWFVYLVNGVSDVAGDRLNSSSRPIARGVLGLERANVISVVLCAFSILVGGVVGLEFSLLCASMLVLGVIYSHGPYALKRWSPSASLTVGAAGFASYVAGAFAYNGAVSSSTVLVAGVMGAWMAAGGNYKDLGDEVGDRSAGRRTLPVLLGRRRAALLIWTVCLAISLLALFATFRDPAIWPAVALVPAAALLARSWAFKQSDEAEGAAGAKFPYRVFMVSQYTVNGLLLVTGSLS